jgi:hypothetical protein
VKPLVDVPTCYSSPEVVLGTVGMAHNIFPLEQLVHQTR